MVEGWIDVAIGVLVYPEPTPGCRVLITRRKHDTVLPGYWEFPGGKAEPNESMPDCLVREFIEEVGLKVLVRDPLPTVEHHYDHGRVRLHPYLCTHDGLPARNLQVAEHCWITPGELKDYRFPPANADLIHVIQQRLIDG